MGTRVYFALFVFLFGYSSSRACELANSLSENDLIVEERVQQLLIKDPKNLGDEYELQDHLRFLFESRNQREQELISQIKLNSIKEREREHTQFKKREGILEKKIQEKAKLKEKCEESIEEVSEKLSKLQARDLKATTRGGSIIGFCGLLSVESNCSSETAEADAQLKALKTNLQELEKAITALEHELANSRISYHHALLEGQYQEQLGINKHNICLEKNREEFHTLVSNSKRREISIKKGISGSDLDISPTSPRRANMYHEVEQDTGMSPHQVGPFELTRRLSASQINANGSTSSNVITQLIKWAVGIEKLVEHNTRGISALAHLTHAERLREIQLLREKHPNAAIFFDEVYKVFFTTILCYQIQHVGKVPFEIGKVEVSAHVLGSVIRTIPGANLIASAVEGTIIGLKYIRRKQRTGNVDKTFHNPKVIEEVSESIALELAKEYEHEIQSLNAEKIKEKAHKVAQMSYRLVTSGKVLEWKKALVTPARAEKNTDRPIVLTVEEISEFIVKWIKDARHTKLLAKSKS